MLLRSLVAIVFIASAFNSQPSLANKSAEPADIYSRYTQYHTDYYVNEDRTHTVRYDLAAKVVKEGAVKHIKSTSISYSTSIENLEIHEAYNLKSDGTRIDVPETNYQQKVNSGKDNKGPVYSDRTSLTIVFPDVEVDDTLTYSYSITTKEPMFPGHFSTQDSFAPDYPYDDVKVTLNVPSSLKASYKIRNMKEKIQRWNDRVVYTWKYSNPTPTKQIREDFSVWDMETYPGYIFSTFASYQEIVDAYAARALPKAAVTPKIEALAKKIIGTESDPKEKARLLYEWVAMNITYAGNCIGVGAVVPHDIDFILDNRMGDCKDQATLLQALLTAENIKSTQALINAGEIYSLPETPTVTAVNHVINYLPELGIYVDATSESIPFGLLHFNIQDKPVLLVNGYEKGLKTPTNAIADSQSITSVINVDSEGNSTGNIEINAHGLSASYARSGFRHTTPDRENEWLKRLFSHSGYEGFGTLTKDDPSSLEDRFKYGVSFNIPKHIPLYGLASFVIRPVMPTELALANVLDVSQKDEVSDVACSPASSEESYTYTFPSNIEIIATPENSTIEGADIYYQSSYEIDKNTLKISRKLVDNTKGNVCSPEYIKSQKEIIQKILWDVNSQVVYKVKKQI